MSKGKPTLHVTLYTVTVISILLFLFNPFIVSRWVALHQNKKAEESDQPEPAYIWPDSPGTFGDSYGALTSLFSLASFALLIYAFIREREDAATQKSLICEQLVEAKIANFAQTLPYFSISPHDETNILIENVGEDALALHAVITGAEGEVLAQGSRPCWRRDYQEYIAINPSPSNEINIRLFYLTKAGEQLTEKLTIHKDRPNDFASSEALKRVEVFREIVRGRVRRLN